MATLRQLTKFNFCMALTCNLDLRSLTNNFAVITPNACNFASIVWSSLFSGSCAVCDFAMRTITHVGQHTNALAVTGDKIYLPKAPCTMYWCHHTSLLLYRSLHCVAADTQTHICIYLPIYIFSPADKQQDARPVLGKHPRTQKRSLLSIYWPCLSFVFLFTIVYHHCLPSSPRIVWNCTRLVIWG